MTKKCGLCGEPVESDILECPRCGSGVFESEKAHREPETIQRKITPKSEPEKKRNWKDKLFGRKKEGISFETQSLSRLARSLLSPDIEKRDAAINLTRQLAREGKRDGLYALEEAIRHMHGGQDVEYYRPHGSRESIKEPFEAAPQKLETLARQKLLWKTSPKKVQMLFEVAAMVADPLLLLDRINLYGGDDQAMAIQLLGTHLIVQDTLAARGVR